jgi:diaminohydroxyphosphoribosylaminopyrimidine deaminase/5-amino-6-(5-phosphoribosylamino)uracil reductase
MQMTIAEPTVWTDTDRRMMARALELATKGVGLVSPGPLVGCVVVGAGGEIVGEGFYVFEEIKHAETIALEIAGEKARGGTAYVSLEPHAHYGRTAPCTDALIAAGIKRVVAPIEDLNPKVSGKGFAHLRAAGINVETGLLRDEATRVNEAYLHYMSTGLPERSRHARETRAGSPARRRVHARMSYDTSTMRSSSAPEPRRLMIRC